MECDNPSRQPLPQRQSVAETLHVKFVPPSPCGGSMAGPSDFIDIKKLRPTAKENTSVQPSDETIHNVTSVTQAFNSARAAGFQAVTAQQELPNPAPTFGDTDKSWLLKQPTRAAEQNVQKKTFDEGPSVPQSLEDSADQFGILLRKNGSKIFYDKPYFKLDTHLPADQYCQGQVKYTTKNALFEMVRDLARLQFGTTGCIVDETCDTEQMNEYNEGVHFLSDQALGQGSYGTVDLCYDSKSMKPFVRKQLKKSLLRSSEIIVPSTLNHPNITKFYGLIQRDTEQDGTPFMELLMEYGGSALNRYILDGNTLSQTQKWDLAKQGLEALVQIHMYSIIHLDIKPENICVMKRTDGSMLLKLTDFGSSRLPQEPLKFVGMTPEYMAPELCMIFLQCTSKLELNWGMTEADITGKVDTFAMGLVIMYLYTGCHILVRVINNGKTTYEGVNADARKMMHYNLMKQMADDCVVQNLIPDECDLDMRDLLIKLTMHNHSDRFSARQALDLIEAKEQRSRQKLEQKKRDQAEKRVILKKSPPIAFTQPPTYSLMADIPCVADVCMETDNGPVKNRTKDALRKKLQPYGKSGKKGKTDKSLNSKTIPARSSLSELNDLTRGIASKQMPMTPILEFQGLTLRQPSEVFENKNTNMPMTERNAPLAHPTEMDVPPTHPTERIAPPTYPTERIAPPTHPTERIAPPTYPTERIAPPTYPTERIAPPTHPTERIAPPTYPTERIAPPTHPTEWNAPLTHPTERNAPLTRPSQESCHGPFQVSQAVEATAGVTSVYPTQPGDNVVSLARTTPATLNMSTNQRQGLVLVNIPQELLEKLIQKKIRAAELARTEREVCPNFIDVRNGAMDVEEESMHVGSTPETSMESQVQLEDSNDAGNIPRFAMFF